MLLNLEMVDDHVPLINPHLCWDTLGLYDLRGSICFSELKFFRTEADSPTLDSLIDLNSTLRATIRWYSDCAKHVFLIIFIL